MNAHTARRIPATLFAFVLVLGMPAAGLGEEPNSSREPLASAAPPASRAPDSQSSDPQATEPQSPEHAEVCKVGDAESAATAGSSRAIAAFQDRLREQMAAELAAEGEAPVVLNGRGYGYGIQTGPRNPADVIRILEREAQAAR